MRARVVVEAPVARSVRVAQVEGQFDMEAAERSHVEWDADLPVEEREWLVGAFVGPSGSGKSTLLREFFGAPARFEWDADSAVIDCFPDVGIKAVTGALSSVGFSSPPAWLRPFRTLSNGEQFRCELARALIEPGDGPAVIDEFTSVVDRTVAKVASAAVRKHVLRAGRQLVVASCHDDIIEWLQPDWVYGPAAGSFVWRSVQPRPPIGLEVYRTTPDAWAIFRRHHYLSDQLARSAQCFVALVEGAPAAFIAVLPQMGHRGIRRVSRTVTAPDFQGVGIGNALTEFIGGVYRRWGYRYRLVTSHPAMISHCARSSRWDMREPPRMKMPHKDASLRATSSYRRLTSSFEYVGPAATKEQAAALEPGATARGAPSSRRARAVVVAR